MRDKDRRIIVRSRCKRFIFIFLFFRFRKQLFPRINSRERISKTRETRREKREREYKREIECDVVRMNESVSVQSQSIINL